MQIAEPLLELEHKKVIWGMQFIRVRKNARPAIVREDGSFEYMHLADDEFIGEEVAALFDSELCIIMIQRNRDSLSPAGIQLFFNKAYQEEEIKFNPLVPQDTLEKIRKKEYRGITIGLTNLRSSVLTKTSILSLIKGIGPYNMVNAEIKLSMGYQKKQEGLNPDEILQTVEQLNGLPELSKLEVSVVEDDLKTRKYDLIEERIHEEIPFSYTKEEQLTYSRVIDRMLDAYNSRRPEIQRFLK